ncbi:hypothetical protein ACQPYH_23130 [Kribbella sp. CA-245084]
MSSSHQSQTTVVSGAGRGFRSADVTTSSALPTADAGVELTCHGLHVLA